MIDQVKKNIFSSLQTPKESKKENRLSLNMFWLIISASITFISGIATQLVELFKFKNAFEKGYWKKRVKGGAFMLFVIAFVLTIYQIKVDNDKIKIENKAAENRRYADSLKIIALLNANKNLNSGMDAANTSLTKLKSLNTNILISQAKIFESTAKKITASADTLMNYIDGKGVGYINIALDPNSLTGYFVLNNPNNFPLRDCYVVVANYQSLDSVIQTKNGLKTFNKEKLKKSAVLIIDEPVLRSGPKSTTLKTTSNVDMTYLVTLSLSGQTFFEELYVGRNGKGHSFRLYKVQRDRLVLIKESKPHIKNELWQKAFSINLENSYNTF